MRIDTSVDCIDLLNYKRTRTGVGITQAEESIYATCGTCGSVIYWEWDSAIWYCSECKVQYPTVPKSAGSSNIYTHENITAIHTWVCRWTGLEAADVVVQVER